MSSYLFHEKGYVTMRYIQTEALPCPKSHTSTNIYLNKIYTEVPPQKDMRPSMYI